MIWYMDDVLVLILRSERILLQVSEWGTSAALCGSTTSSGHKTFHTNSKRMVKEYHALNELYPIFYHRLMDFFCSSSSNCFCTSLSFSYC